MNYQSMISLIGCLGSVVFGALLLNFPNRRSIHSLLSLTLILNGLTTLMRTLFWELDSPIFNQLSTIGLSILPLVTALFIEKVAEKQFRGFQKIFFIFSSATLFLFSLNSSMNQNKIYLVSLLSFHVLSIISYILLLKKGKREAVNLKHKNIISCLLIAFYSIFILALVDWAHKFGYFKISLFPLSVSIFIYYLSIIIYSPGKTSWGKETLKLFNIALVSAFIGVVCFLQLEVSFLNCGYFSLTAFSLIVTVFAVYNQLHVESESFFATSKPMLDWDKENFSCVKFMKELNDKPEFHHLRIIKKSFVLRNGCEEIYDSFFDKNEVISKEKIEREYNKVGDRKSEQNHLQVLLFLFEATDSDYMVMIPYTQHFIAVKFINIVNPDLYSDFLFGVAHKLALFFSSEQVTS